MPDPNEALPKGVVLDKDGKPCRTCTSSAEWQAMMKKRRPFTMKLTQAGATVGAVAAATATKDEKCPPDVEELGNASWTLLHSITATYPETPTRQQETNASMFVKLFAKMYPCWVCAVDFEEWMAQPENDPDQTGEFKTQDGFGRWMCRAHNAVNVKLGKKQFDCDLWKQRWKDGWKDGRCD